MPTILVFTEDEHWRADSLNDEIRERGITIKSYCCPIEFVNELFNYRADSVLLDLDATREKTEKLIRIVRNIQPKLTIGLMANNRENPQLVSALSLGVFSYFFKPLSLNNLETLFSKVIRKNH